MLNLAMITNQEGPMTKRIFVDVAGTLQKEACATLYRGYVKRYSLGSLAEFTKLLQKLKPSQCLTYGVPRMPFAHITLDKWTTGDTISRTRKHFSWPSGPGIWMLDHDGVGLSPADLHGIIIDALPELRNVAMLWTASASSYIYNGDQELAGARGQRLYVPVTRAQWIPYLGELLIKRLWLRGHGRIELAVDGKRLRRTVVDSMVWQPERIDFAAGALCEPPLEQRRPPNRIFGEAGRIFDPRCAIPLRAEEEARYKLLTEETSGKRKRELELKSEIRLSEREKDRIRKEKARRVAGKIPRDAYLGDRAAIMQKIRYLIGTDKPKDEVLKQLAVSPRTANRALAASNNYNERN